MKKGRMELSPFWRNSITTQSRLVSLNPAKPNEILGEVLVSTDAEIQDAVAAAKRAQPAWANLTFAKRIEFLEKLYQGFKRVYEEMSLLMTREMGMPITGARGSMSWSLSHFKWYLKNAEASLRPEITFEDDRTIHEIYYEPFGVVSIIAPWNFPISNFVMTAIQPLLAGNTVVYKLSEEVPMFGVLLDRLFAESGIPTGVFNQVYGDGEVGEKLARSDVDFIHFTGSYPIGKHLYKIAAEKFIPVILELGGSDAGIIFEDSNVDEILESVYENKFSNSGQICCGLKRLFVHHSLQTEVEEKFTALLKRKQFGDPTKETTNIGPLASARQQRLIDSQVKDAIDKGAMVLLGGKIPAGAAGAHFEPTLLCNVKANMRVWKEEVFGPVLTIVPFKNEDEAIELANDTEFGLSAYVYTNDKEKFLRVAKQLKAGSISHNGVDYSGPYNPFGGFKHSGMGRACGKAGFQQVCQIKVISRLK